MYLPNEPAMLLSVVNTWLRDNGGDLDDLLREADLDSVKGGEMLKKLEEFGYSYDDEVRAFKPVP